MLHPALRHATLFAVLSCAACLHTSPGTLYESSTAPLTAEEAVLRQELQRDVEHLSIEIGPRNAGYSLGPILNAERWLLGQLMLAGVEAHRDEVDVNVGVVANVVATFEGVTRPEEVVLIGAHYDSVASSPGANDNGSGVALLLAMARRLKDQPTDRTVRLVFFVNEENPFTGGLQMGSRVHAMRSRASGDEIVLMISVDSIGYFSSQSGSQNYPAFIFGLPSVGNFIAFVSNTDNSDMVDRTVEVFQSQSRFPSIGIATDMADAARSDHASFLWEDYPAMTMSDTSEFRDPHYHKPTDVAANINYDELARLAAGFLPAIRSLADAATALPSP